MSLAYGVIGIGVIGTAVATRLLACGHTVTVHSRREASTAPMAALGARVAASARQVAGNADIVITCLNSAPIVEAVVFGQAGVAEAAGPEKLLVDLSSIDPGATAALSARLAEARGMAWVDAPLSGGAPAALEGRLTLMMGGTEADVARARSALGDLARNMTHMGPSGAGQTTKLINQVLCASAFMAVAEACRLAEGADVDAARIPAALAGGRADSAILQEFMGKMAARDETPTGRIDNMLKDLEAVESFAASKRIPMPVTGLITELHRVLIASGFGPEDNVSYLKLFDGGRG